MTEQIPFHSIADLIPAMTDDEYQALKSDIAAYGQREPIVLLEGQILDGRNRYRACCELGIEPRLREWQEPGLATDFVVSENLRRRHLSPGQRAAVAVQAEAMREAEADGRGRQREGGKKAGRKRVPQKVVEIVPQPIAEPKVRDQVAQQFNTNPRYVQDAKTIRDAAPELLDRVKRGTITLPQAKQEVRRQQKRAELETKAKEARKKNANTSTWKIRRGNCLAILPTLTEKARLIFCDPPYNIGINYGDGVAHDRLPSEKYLDWCRQWIALCAGALTDDGSLWVMINDEWADHFGLMLREAGLYRRSWVKWLETFGVNCINNFNRCSRHIFYCVRDRKHFVFNPDAVTRPSDRQTKYADKRANPGGKLWDDVWQIPRLTGTCKERIPGFPTQLPLALLEPIVLCASDLGDLVIDPFSGSGTTGVAAIRNGRRYVGIEKSKKFTDLARLRLEGVGPVL